MVGGSGRAGASRVGVAKRKPISCLQKGALFKLSPLPASVEVTNAIIVKPNRDGIPAMVFACAHPGQEKLIFGASEPNWNGFPQVAQVTREAYNALFLKETEMRASLADTKIGSGNANVLIWESRQRAIAAMKEGRSSLGGTGELALALYGPGWSKNQPCYTSSFRARGHLLISSESESESESEYSTSVSSACMRSAAFPPVHW